jgi:hypothetical protein
MKPENALPQFIIPAVQEFVPITVQDRVFRRLESRDGPVHHYHPFRNKKLVTILREFVENPRRASKEYTDYLRELRETSRYNPLTSFVQFEESIKNTRRKHADSAFSEREHVSGWSRGSSAVNAFLDDPQGRRKLKDMLQELQRNPKLDEDQRYFFYKDITEFVRDLQRDAGRDSRATLLNRAATAVMEEVPWGELPTDSAATEFEATNVPLIADILTDLLDGRITAAHRFTPSNHYKLIAILAGV